MGMELGIRIRCRIYSSMTHQSTPSPWNQSIRKRGLIVIHFTQNMPDLNGFQGRPHPSILETFKWCILLRSEMPFRLQARTQKRTTAIGPRNISVHNCKHDLEWIEVNVLSRRFFKSYHSKSSVSETDAHEMNMPCRLMLMR